MHFKKIPKNHKIEKNYLGSANMKRTVILIKMIYPSSL